MSISPETGFYEYARQGLDRTGDKPAIWFYGKSMTYRELFDRIDNVADHLYRLGVRKGTVVTIHLPNCPQAVMAIYAVAKLGGICSMDHALTPPARLRENMERRASRTLITGDHFAECGEVDFADRILYVRVGAHMGLLYQAGYQLKNRSRRPAGAISFESLEGPCTQRAACPPPRSLAQACAFYLQSTGTSGTPKTVMLSHAAANAWQYDVDDYYAHVPQTGRPMLCVLPLFHGAGLVLDMHHCVAGKMQQVLMAKFSAAEAVRLLRKHRVEVMTGIPAMYEKLLAQPKFSGRTLPALRECFVSGDTVPLDLKLRFDARLDPAGGRHFLYEGYGMTETVTAIVSIGQAHDRRESSGYPLPNCRAAVWQDGKILPAGEGELLLQANTMMMGYLDQNDEDCFLADESGRWLRSGDLGRIDEDGFVYCLGRLKDIIIHNGYNVLPAQVEHALRSAPGVQEACVVGIWDPDRSTQKIRAYLVLKAGSERPREAELRNCCAKYLPRYAIPGEFRFLRELPRNRMAKIDRRALEALP